jgi:hypothetical protein
MLARLRFAASSGDLMPTSSSEPQTFVEMVLTLLEDRFPWLGKDSPATGSDVVETLSDLHTTLRKALRCARRRRASAVTR